MPALAAALLFVFCCLSFSLNAFRVVPQDVYAAHQVDSDALVIDALRTGQPILGREVDGTYKPYLSQFGGQLQTYRLLDRLGFPAGGFALLNTLLLSAVVAALTFFVSREMFGLWGGLAFGLCLASSPWLVAFSKSIYWVAWTWFLPLLVSTALGQKMLASNRQLLLPLLLLYAGFFYKFLSGYEFATTMVIAACAPLVYFGLGVKSGVRRALLVMVLIGATSVLAFGSAVALHALKVGETLSDGLRIVHATAAKRVALGDVETAAREGCLATPQENYDTCHQNIVRSLSAPRGIILASYLTFRGSIPWLAGTDVINEPALEATRQALRRLNFRAAAGEMAGVSGAMWLTALRLPLTLLLVAALLGLCAMRLWRNRPASAPDAALIGFSALAPLSWFIVASGHSYGHLQINFVLWTLPFLPFVVGYVVKSWTDAPAPASRR